MTQAPTRHMEARPSLLTDFDLYLFNEGTHARVYEKLGAHVTTVDGTPGVIFSVWAPNADAVSVIGDPAVEGFVPDARVMAPGLVTVSLNTGEVLPRKVESPP